MTERAGDLATQAHYRQACELVAKFNRDINAISGVLATAVTIHWDDDHMEGPQVLASRNDINGLFRLATALNDSSATVLANLLINHGELQSKLSGVELPPDVQEFIDNLTRTKSTKIKSDDSQASVDAA